MITQFMDMHSGGMTKEPPYEYIYIEAPENEARSVFYANFGHNPARVSCTCCGDDYSISEYQTFEEATLYERAGYKYPGSLTDFSREVKTSVSDYLAQPDVLFIPAEDIKDDECHVSVPSQGFVWMD